MIKLLLRSAFRNLQNRKWYTLLSIMGLSVGFSAFIIISLFIKYELSWDRFNENYDHIYRIQTYKVNEGERIMQSPPAINEFIKNKYHDIKNQSLVYSDQRLFLSAAKEENPFELDGQFADQEYLDMFTYDFISGNGDKALREPMSIILSETAVQVLFGDGDPSNQTIWLGKKYQLKVTGIYHDLPHDAHLRPEFVISINSLKRIWDNPQLFDDWNKCFYYNYLQTSGDADINHLNAELKKLLYDKVLTDKRQLYLRPLSKLYMYSTNDNYTVIIYLLTAFSILVLILASINYMNLIIATSSLRAKEIGIKKVIGSSRRQLMAQVFTEGLLITIVSFFMSILLVELALNHFNQAADKQISLSLLMQDNFFGLIFGIIFLVSALSSIYPSWIITSIKSIDLFKSGIGRRPGKKVNLKKVLVSFQFAISIGLITTAILLSKQVIFMNNQDLGFEKQDLVIAEIDISNDEVSIEKFTETLVSNPGIKSVSVSRGFPMTSGRHTSQRMVNWEGGAREERIETQFFWISYDYVETLGMEIVKGRDFSRDFPSDPVNGCLINETAARQFGWDEPIGKYIDDKQLMVVGIFRDIHFHDIYNQIKPMVLILRDEESAMRNYTYLGFKIKPDTFSESYSAISATLLNFFPNDPYTILSFDNHFANDQHFAIFDSIINVITFLAIVAIVLSILGVVGLVNHSLNQRTKEIAIRKVSGSTSWLILRSLTCEFIVIIFFASLLGTLGASYIFNDFPLNYHMPFRVFDYLIGIIIALFVTLLSIAYKTFKESRRNPVEALRYE